MTPVGRRDRVKNVARGGARESTSLSCSVRELLRIAAHSAQKGRHEIFSFIGLSWLGSGHGDASSTRDAPKHVVPGLAHVYRLSWRDRSRLAIPVR